MLPVKNEKEWPKIPYLENQKRIMKVELKLKKKKTRKKCNRL